MMREHTNLIVWPSLLAVGLVAAACSDQTNVSTAPKRPSFWAGGETCTTQKWTGGGRIDPTDPPSANHDGTDEPAGGMPTVTDPPPIMAGKVTFGFNVFLGSDNAGNCIVTKGEIEVNWHNAKLAWHVSIHDGVDAYDNQPVFAVVVGDKSGGQCVIVGLPNTPPTGSPAGYMTARINPQQGFEKVQFEGCDNDRGGPQNTGSDAMRWRAASHGDTRLTYLTGGNIVDHGS
jgi:hypothetical protein